MRALVTGGSGFIGAHLLPVLSDLNIQVTQVVRREVRSESEINFAHLSQTDLASFDVIFHLAGLAHEGAQGASNDVLTSVNVDQTEVLYRQAVAAGVRRFVWLSSIKVLGDISESPFRPGDVYNAQGTYAQSKAAAEQQLLGMDARDTDLVIVRPPLVYGPGVKANFLRLLALANSPWPLPLGDALAPRAMVSAHNLVDLLLTLARQTNTSPTRIWHVRDGSETSVRGVMLALAEGFGREARLFSVPTNIALQLGQILGRVELMERLFCPLQVDMSATESLLSWHPPHVQTEQLQQVAQWYLHQ